MHCSFHEYKEKTKLQIYPVLILIHTYVHVYKDRKGHIGIYAKDIKINDNI